jgi:hypothetical protein
VVIQAALKVASCIATPTFDNAFWSPKSTCTCFRVFGSATFNRTQTLADGEPGEVVMILRALVTLRGQSVSSTFNILKYEAE